MDELSLEIRCGLPAPAVVNGGAYLGCVLPKGHEGNHEVKILWSTS